MDAYIRNYILNLAKNCDDNKNIKLPSENELSELFGINRHAVRKIYGNLEKMGLVYSVQGLGRFMIMDKPEINLDLTGTSFTKKMKDQNIPLETVNLGAEKIKGEELNNIRNKGLTGNVYRISRLRKLYGIPSAIHISYLSDSRFPDIKNEGLNILSIHEYYYSKDITNFKNSKSIVSVKLPDVGEIEILEIGSLVPLLILEGKLYDSSNNLIEIVNTKYRSDLFKYYLG